MDLSELDYELPPELIAQHPAERRDASRLLVYERETGAVRHRTFAELPDELPGLEIGSLLSSTTRRWCRLGSRSSPRAAKCCCSSGTRTGRGRRLHDRRDGCGRAGGTGPSSCSSTSARAAGACAWRASPTGETPLPPYITEPLGDPSRYQTVYAREPGSAAAPTAGLHFTPELLARLDPVRVTLHVGLDTFRPVTEERLEEHRIHGERYEVEPEAWERIEAAERVLAVGTTTVRVLETLARGGPLAGRTELFITPGFEFRRVDALLTNFHLPRSTLLALVMAFAGIEETRRLYRLAVEERYRFFSFGDAMLLL